MSLPAGFQFSQGSLQDYVDCHRRFQLKYLLRLAWPAIESEPALENERFMQQGARFHRLVQQHLLCVPAERLAVFAREEDLERWWENYLRDQNPSGVQEIKAHFPEISLSAALGGFRLVAKYDWIVAGADGCLVIVDWKTSRKRTKRKWLLERLQSRVYPYLLVQVATGATHVLSCVAPEQVEMVYWFAEFPGQPERIAYSQQQCEQDGAYLEGLVADIQRRGADDFGMTSDEKRCACCVYRSLCERGVGAGDLGDLDEAPEEPAAPEIALDFDQIAEIEF